MKQRKKPELFSNASSMRRANIRSVYNLILKHGTISRRELSHITTLRPPTISSIIRELQEDGLVVNRGKGEGNPNGGPIPELYSVNNLNEYFIGLCINHIFLIGVVLSPEREVRCIRRIPMDAALSAHSDRLLSALDSIMNECLDHIRSRSGKAVGVGISCAGLADFSTGRVTLSIIPSLNQTREMCLTDYFEKKYGLRAYLDNDINMLLSALQTTSEELMNAQTTLCIGISEYTGMSLITEGTLYRGANNLAGNLLMFEDMPRMRDIFTDIEECIASGMISPRQIGLTPGEALSSRHIQQAIRDGERSVIDRLLIFAEGIGRCVAKLQQVIDAEYIVIFCPIFEHGDEIFSRVTETYCATAFAPYHSAKFIKKVLDDELFAASAAQWVFHMYYRVE